MPVQQLSFDVYVHILKQIPASVFSDDGLKTPIACSETNTTFRVAASLASGATVPREIYDLRSSQGELAKGNPR